MIFVSGIHGVGKTFFCNMIKEKLNIKSYSASQLIAAKRKSSFSERKLVSDIDDNQCLLLTAVEELRRTSEEFILDGHFCLLNEDRNITRIPLDTFVRLNPDAIILLTENPEIIAERRQQRDNVQQSVLEIKAFQEAEKLYAEEIAEQFNIPLVISQGEGDLDRMLDFIKERGH